MSIAGGVSRRAFIHGALGSGAGFLIAACTNSTAPTGAPTTAPQPTSPPAAAPTSAATTAPTSAAVVSATSAATPAAAGATPGPTVIGAALSGNNSAALPN